MPGLFEFVRRKTTQAIQVMLSKQNNAPRAGEHDDDWHRSPQHAVCERGDARSEAGGTRPEHQVETLCGCYKRHEVRAPWKILSRES